MAKTETRLKAPEYLLQKYKQKMIELQQRYYRTSAKILSNSGQDTEKQSGLKNIQLSLYSIVLRINECLD